MANGRVLGHDGIWLLAVTRQGVHLTHVTFVSNSGATNRHPAQELCGVEGGAQF